VGTIMDVRPLSLAPALATTPGVLWLPVSRKDTPAMQKTEPAKFSGKKTGRPHIEPKHGNNQSKQAMPLRFPSRR
jgi:hypothetical protein